MCISVPKGLVKNRFLSLILRVSDSGGLPPEDLLSNKLPGNRGAAGPEIILGETLASFVLS